MVRQLMDRYIDILNAKEYQVFKQELQKLNGEQLVELYKLIRVDPKLRLVWEVYDAFVDAGYDISLVHNKTRTLFQDCKDALGQSWLLRGSVFITRFICKLLDLGYLMSDDALAELDGFQMLELAITYTRPADLKTILRSYPKTPDSKLLYVAIDHQPLMVTPLLEVTPMRSDLLLYAINNLNKLGQQTSTEIPPLMDRDALIEYLQMTEEQYESFEAHEEGEDVIDRLRVIHTIKDFIMK